MDYFIQYSDVSDFHSNKMSFFVAGNCSWIILYYVTGQNPRPVKLNSLVVSGYLFLRAVQILELNYRW